MMYRIRNWLVATLLLLCAQVGAATLSDIQVSNGNQQARITLSFIGDPDYAFSHQSKRTVALDIKQTGVIQGLPLLFSGNNLVKAIRSGTPKDAKTLRLVVDLTENGRMAAITLSSLRLTPMCRHRLLRRLWLRNALKRLRLSHRASANRRAIRLKRKVTALQVLSAVIR